MCACVVVWVAVSLSFPATCTVSVVIVFTTFVVSGATGVTIVVVSFVSVDFEFESLLQAAKDPAMAKMAMNFFMIVCFCLWLRKIFPAISAWYRGAPL